MPSKARYYKVFKDRKKQRKAIDKLVKSKRKRKIITTLVGAYCMLVVFGVFVFSSILLGNGDIGTSYASEEPAKISTSIRLTDEETYSVGDSVNAVMIVQNTSVTDNIHRAVVTLENTNQSIEWDDISINNKISREEPVWIDTNSFLISNIAPGERIEVAVSGAVRKTNFDFLAVIGRIVYENADGTQSTETNKVFTQVGAGASDELLRLTTDKTQYKIGEKISLLLEHPEENRELIESIKGSINISDGEDVRATADCELGNYRTCQKIVENLPAGNYSALFIDEAGRGFSQIVEFSIIDPDNELTPDSDASMDILFGNTSLNGQVAVRAERVISQNEDYNNKECKFLVYDQDDESKPVFEQEFALNSDRICYGTINTSDVPEPGEYTIKLNRSNESSDVLFGDVIDADVALKILTTEPEFGQNIDIESKSIKQLADDTKDYDGFGTLHIFHPKSGSYIRVDNLEYIGGNMSYSIPPEVAFENGFYQIIMELEDIDEDGENVSRFSAYSGFSFAADSIGHTGSGVLVDNFASLRAGEAMKFSVNGVRDRIGNTISSGECGATVYQASQKPTSQKGSIESGVCQVEFASGVVSKAGLATVSFYNESDSFVSIPQTRSVNIAPGDVDDYGLISLMVEPMLRGFANRVFVGPVVDSYGNLVDGESVELKLASKQGDNLFDTKASVVDGYADINIPVNSIPIEDTATLEIWSKGAKQLSREVKIEDSRVANLPTFETEVSTNDNIRASLTAFNYDKAESCQLKYIKSISEVSIEKANLDLDTGDCSFDWSLKEYRGVSKALLTLEVENFNYSSIISQSPSQPGSEFALLPQLEYVDRDRAKFSLVTSPIADKSGLVVDNAIAKLEYNAKLAELAITNGLGKINIVDSMLSASDIRNIGGYDLLDIDIDSRASADSYSIIDGIRMFVDGLELVEDNNNFDPYFVSNSLSVISQQVVVFSSQDCEARDQANNKLTTHYQEGLCYVMMVPGLGVNQISMGSNGYDSGVYTIKGSQESSSVSWCSSAPCEVKMLTQSEGEFEVVIHDGDSQYNVGKYAMDESALIVQNGLNPYKEYKVEVKYMSESGQVVSSFNHLLGEWIMPLADNQ